MKSLIFTMVNRQYQWYVPLFTYCAKKAYPEADVLVYCQNKCILPEYHMRCVLEACFEDFPESNINSLRFLLGNTTLSDYDNVLITDVDIMMMREDPPYYTQRLKSMQNNKTECYDNYRVGNRCPAVHFVTRDWWLKTATARKQWFQRLSSEMVDRNQDEVILLDIIIRSGLPMPSVAPALWNQHGLHLGKWRTRKYMRANIGPEGVYMDRLLKDGQFMKLVEECSKHLTAIDEIFRLIREKVRG